MSKILAIAKTNLLDIFRDLRSNAITFVLPAIFVLIFGFLFSQTTEISIWNVGVIDDEEIAKTLETVNDEADEKIFEVEIFSEKDQAVAELKERNLQIILGREADQKILVISDKTNQRSTIAKSIVRDVFAPVQDDHIVYENVVGRENISGFELMASGLIIYGILIIIPHVAGAIARLEEKRYLLRYITSKATAFEILSGFTISHLVLGIIQTILLFYVTTWFGLKLDTYSLQAAIFLIPVIFFSIGIGLLIGSFFEKGEAGQNLGIMFSIILGFLSGSFIIGIENIGIEIGERFFSITSLIPTYYAYDGMTKLIVFNSSFDTVIDNLIVISLSAILVFFIGVYSYHRKNFKRT